MWWEERSTKEEAGRMEMKVKGRRKRRRHKRRWLRDNIGGGSVRPCYMEAYVILHRPQINKGIRLKEEVPFVEQCSIASVVSFPCGSSQFMFHIEWVCHCSTCSAVNAIATYSAWLTFQQWMRLMNIQVKKRGKTECIQIILLLCDTSLYSKKKPCSNG